MNEDISLFQELNSITLFDNFTESELNEFIRNCEQKDYKKGEYLFKEGDQSGEIIVLISGCLEIFQSNRLLLSIQNKGLAGEMGVFTEEPRAATIQASEDSITLILTSQNLNNLIDSNKSLGLKIYKNVIKIISDNLRKSNTMFEFHQMIS